MLTGDTGVLRRSRHRPVPAGLVDEVGLIRTSESTFEGMVALQLQGYPVHQIRSTSPPTPATSCGETDPKGPCRPCSADEKEHTHEASLIGGGLVALALGLAQHLWPEPTPSLPTSGRWMTVSESAPGQPEHPACGRNPTSGRRTRTTALIPRSGARRQRSSGHRWSAHEEAYRRGPRGPRNQSDCNTGSPCRIVLGDAQSGRNRSTGCPRRHPVTDRRRGMAQYLNGSHWPGPRADHRSQLDRMQLNAFSGSGIHCYDRHRFRGRP